MAGPTPDQTLHGGLMRHVTFLVMAMVKAAATAVIKAKTGIEREATSTAVEITDMLVDNAFGRVLKILQVRNPKNFVDGLASVMGHRAIRSGNSWLPSMPPGDDRMVLP